MQFKALVLCVYLWSIFILCTLESFVSLCCYLLLSKLWVMSSLFIWMHKWVKFHKNPEMVIQVSQDDFWILVDLTWNDPLVMLCTTVT